MRILVTGGASGLGEAITRACAALPGSHVAFTFHRSSENAGRLRRDLPNTEAISCDFTNPADVEALAGRIGTMGLDVLVNNAYVGEWMKTHFHKIEAREFADDFAKSVMPTIAVTQAAIADFRRRKSGRIVTILTSALVGPPPVGTAPYVANKAYLAQLSRVWATENAKFNIASNTVSPAFMRTAATAGTDERLVEQMQGNHPLGRLLAPGEVAQAVVFLCQASTQVNGIDIPINAGTGIR